MNFDKIIRFLLYCKIREEVFVCFSNLVALKEKSVELSVYRWRW